jgi:two-component system nitrate/nitrite response regulator NarL
MKCFNLLIVAQNRLFRDGLKRLFDGSSFYVVAELPDPARMVQDLPAEVLIDIILIELIDEDVCGVEWLRSLRAALPAAKIVVLASRIAPGMLADMSDYVSALLSKDLSSSALFHTLELVMLDEGVISIALTFLMAQKEPLPVKTTDLSSREMQILRHLANGLPNKAIARELDVAETTVKAYVKTILKKANVENRTQAAIWCIAKGLNNTDQPSLGKDIPYSLGAVEVVV